MAQPLTWTGLLADRRVKPHKTSLAEIQALSAVVERDLKDAKVREVSADRRFATAYNAVLQLATMVVACSGYRVAGSGHHETTLRAFEIAMGAEASALAAYFQTCRRKRNQVDYDMANVATDYEADDLVEKAGEFRTLVSSWIEKHHRQYGL
jgi:uncharacterized protein (UPF0332 family)